MIDGSLGVAEGAAGEAELGVDGTSPESFMQEREASGM